MNSIIVRNIHSYPYYRLFEIFGKFDIKKIHFVMVRVTDSCSDTDEYSN